LNFDKKWETEIYKKKRQINKYPYTSIVSAVNRIFNDKKLKRLHALDLGCGSGNNTKFLIDFGFKNVVSIDGSKSIIKEAKKIVKSNKCKFICADFNEYNFGKEKYDLIIDRGSITHNKKKNINKIYKKVNLALKKNGYFISHVFSSKHTENRKTKSKSSFKQIMRVSNGMIASFFSKKEIFNLFKDFKIIEINHLQDNNIQKKYTSAFWYVVVKKNN